MIRILRQGKDAPEEILRRAQSMERVSEAVCAILDDVRARGDAAVMEYNSRFDGAGANAPLPVGDAEWEEAIGEVDADFYALMERAAANIRAFHEKQKRTGFLLSEKEGVVLGQRVLPLATVGLYAPGGTARYPSSVLMNAIPAKLAGVENILLATPARGGRIPPELLAAAKIAGVDRVYKMGGAQAVGAFAYGTGSVPRCDKIVGPGNAYVAEAKRQVYGLVDIDMIAGPSEILIVADESAKPAHVAADLLSQAEHDRDAAAVLVTTSEALALAVQSALEKQLESLPRREIARASIENNGKIVLVESLEAALDIANRLAPEHLELALSAPFDCLHAVKNAGSVFLGHYAPEALGDYFAGPNHTLPTSGTARFASPLSVDDFVKKYSFTYYTREALRGVWEDVRDFALREGLEAHARSAAIRFAPGEEERA